MACDQDAVWCQSITWTNDDIVDCILRDTLQWTQWNLNKKIFSQQNAFENVVRKQCLVYLGLIGLTYAVGKAIHNADMLIVVFLVAIVVHSLKTINSNNFLFCS